MKPASSWKLHRHSLNAAKPMKQRPQNGRHSRKPPPNRPEMKPPHSRQRTMPVLVRQDPPRPLAEAQVHPSQQHRQLMPQR